MTEYYRDPKTVQKGDFFRRMGRNYKVLGVVEGYAVLRLKGSAPMLWHCRELVNGKHGWFDLQADPNP